MDMMGAGLPRREREGKRARPLARTTPGRNAAFGNPSQANGGVPLAKPTQSRARAPQTGIGVERVSIVVSSQDIQLDSAPIRADWVIEGRPVARNAVLARSADRVTLLWDCTAGAFHWVYDQDETIHIIEGGVTLTLPDGRVEVLGAGDVVFFPAGSCATWKVDAYVRKLAVFRESMPEPMALLVRLRGKLRQRLAARLPAFAALQPALQIA